MSKPHRGQVVPAGDGEQRRHYTQLEQINQPHPARSRRVRPGISAICASNRRGEGPRIWPNQIVPYGKTF